MKAISANPHERKMEASKELFAFFFGTISGLIQFLFTGGYWGGLAEAALTAIVCALSAKAGTGLWELIKKWWVTRKTKTK